MMCLGQGKAVLCEKPLGMNTSEVKRMTAEAASRKLFLMEAMWTRFIPATEKLLELLGSGIIGNPLFMHADFGFKTTRNPEGRLFNKKLGGGSLMDIGIYPIYLSLLVLGVPNKIKATARMTETGVDSYCAMLFDHQHSAKAFLESTFEADTPIEAIIYGEKGSIKMHSSMHHSKKISVIKDGNLKDEFELPYKGHGYIYEIESVNRCLLNNEEENAKMPHRMSLDLITVIDRVKNEIGLHYDVD
jgi:predicted dehydrogenase